MDAVLLSIDHSIGPHPRLNTFRIWRENEGRLAFDVTSASVWLEWNRFCLGWLTGWNVSPLIPQKGRIDRWYWSRAHPKTHTHNIWETVFHAVCAFYVLWDTFFIDRWRWSCASNPNIKLACTVLEISYLSNWMPFSEACGVFTKTNWAHLKCVCYPGPLWANFY